MQNPTFDMVKMWELPMMMRMVIGALPPILERYTLVDKFTRYADPGSTEARGAHKNKGSCSRIEHGKESFSSEPGTGEAKKLR